ncbi:MAG: TlpA family protein disulfide reductase [Mycobacteriaceae bacterium]|nr:TlpA family protein disulfide reductase [Mycobacteriaceae bacterium]
MAVLLFGAAAAACATGKDAVAQGGTFQFVSPGGKTEIFYDPPASRGTVGDLRGPSLTEPRKVLSLHDFDGKVVVLNLWGQWCGPCRGEVGYLESVYQHTKDSGVAFLGIDVRETSPDKARDFVLDNHVSYPSVYDPAMRSLVALGGRFPTSVIPTTLVLDRKHRVAAVFLRAVTVTDLEPVVKRVAAEDSPHA